MDNFIHAHKLMDFIQSNPQVPSLADLKTAFENQFGDVRFTNCTNQIYTFEEIVGFSSQRNKIQYKTNGVEVNEEHRCDHN